MNELVDNDYCLSLPLAYDNSIIDQGSVLGHVQELEDLMSWGLMQCECVGVFE